MLQQIEYFEDEDVEAVIIRDKNIEIKQLEQDMMCLNDIFRDLALMVNDQGEHLTIAERQTEEAVVKTEEGVEKLKQAEEYSVNARRRGWLLKGALVFSGITVGGIGLTAMNPVIGILTGGIGLTAMSPVIGILTAGAGITGIVSCIGIAIKKNK